MERQFENRNLKLENCDIPPKKPFFPETESPSHNSLSATPAWQTGHLSALRHGNPAYKGFSVIPACRSISQPTSNRSHPSIPPGPRHGDPAYNALSAIPTCPTGHLSTLRHGYPAHNALSAIPAWQRGLPAALRHGNPTHRYLRGILAEPLLVGASDSSRNGLHEIHLARAVIDYQVVSD